MQRLNNLENFDIKFEDQIRNREDAVLDTKAGFALLSCDPGRDYWNTVTGPLINATSPQETGVYIWHYADPSSLPRKLELLGFDDHLPDFHPLGIEYQPVSKFIAVANLARSSSRIEMLKLSTTEGSATHIRTLEHSLLSAPNSILALSEIEFLITNDHYFNQRNGPKLGVLETYLGAPGGRIVYVNLGAKSATRAPVVRSLGRLNFANGIARINASTIAVASSGLAAIKLYTIEQSDHAEVPKLTHSRTINVPCHVDNLSADDHGRLLIGGHPHAPTLEEVAKDSAREAIGDLLPALALGKKLQIGRMAHKEGLEQHGRHLRIQKHV